LPRPRELLTHLSDERTQLGVCEWATAQLTELV
jgi:hypothetical protein